MDRTAKGLRMSCGIVLLFNIVGFFLPLTRVTQSSYSDINYSQWNYIRYVFQGSLPHSESMKEYGLTAMAVVVIIGAIILPLIISLLAGVFGLIGNARQKLTSIGAFIVCLCYLFLVFGIEYIWPTPGPEQIFSRGIAIIVNPVISGVAAVLGIFSLIMTPRIRGNQSADIPQVKEMKEEKQQAQYAILEQQEPQEELIAQEVKRTGPRGVIVGLTGMYAGAEIPLKSGETIKFGRSTDNDLIFDNQSQVSRHHCELTWYAERKKYSIRDYSSGGSYINNSEECLPQNIELWLDTGTEIDIGNANNRFRLE